MAENCFGRFQRVVWLAALAMSSTLGVHAASPLHRYTFNDGTVNDSIGGANATIVDPMGTFAHFNAGRLDLSANTGAGPANPITSTNGAFVQLPNGLFTSSVTGGAISLEMWVNVATNRANSRLWSFGSNIPNGTSPYWGQFTDWVDLNGQNGGGNLALTTHEGLQGFNVNEALNAGPLSTGTLHQVVATLDANDTQAGTNPSGTMRLYVDKVLAATQAISPGLTLNGFDDSENDNFLGRSQWGDPLFDGQIDEFSIYGSALTQNDINTAFTTGPVPTPIPTFVINRGTGEVRVENHTSIAFRLKSYSIASTAGSLDVVHWNSITDTGDSNSGGSFDPTNVWSKQSALATQLAESTTGTGGQLAATTGTRSLGNAWLRTPFQDLQVNYILGDGSTGIADVSYLGNPIARSDLNGDGLINAADWTIFLANSNKSFTGQAAAQAYLGGDLNGDGVNNYRDFRLFQNDYIAQNGQAAFDALLSGNVPEPSALLLAIVGILGLLFGGGRHRAIATAKCLLLVALVAIASTAIASTPITFTASADPGLNPDANTGTADAWTTTPTGTGGSGSGYFAPFTLTPTPWVLFSYPIGGVNGVIQADHVLDGGALSIGQSVKVDVANRAVAAGGSVGVSLTSGGTVVATFKFSGGDPNGVYRYDDAAGANQSTGEPFAYQTVQTFEFGLNSATTYTAAYGLSSWNGTIPAGPIDGVRVFNSGGGDASDLVFNNLVVGNTSLVPLSLEVNKTTGDVKIKGNPSLVANLNYYQISSVAGALDQVHWNSLDQQNLNAVDGPDPGTVAGDSVTEGWDKDPNATSGLLTEYFLRAGGAALAGGSSLSLGTAYNTSTFGGANGDLQFSYGIAGGPRLTGVVTYVTSAAVIGDYNGNGIVDAADYTLWRDHLGQSFALQNRDPANGSGPISAADYTSWKANFGAHSGSGAGSSLSSVPEPSSIVLLIIGAIAFVVRRR
jgi:hypothetical protein